MLLVVDANVLFGALIGRGKTLEILFSDKISLLAPEFLFEEFEKHKLEIAEKGKVSLLELNEVLLLIKEKIKLISSEEVSFDIKSRAKSLSPHSKDDSYFAVALAFNALMWSEEKSFKKQSKVKIYNTFELVKLIES